MSERPTATVSLRAGDRVLVPIYGDGPERALATVENPCSTGGSVVVRLDAPIAYDEGGSVWRVFRNPADCEPVVAAPARPSEAAAARRVLRPGWVRASDLREGDLVRLDASTETRETWREVIETYPVGDDADLRRWGDVYVRVRIRWVEKRRVSLAVDQAPYEDDSWVSTILPAEKLVEVLDVEYVEPVGDGPALAAAVALLCEFRVGFDAYDSAFEANGPDYENGTDLAARIDSFLSLYGEAAR